MSYYTIKTVVVLLTLFIAGIIFFKRIYDYLIANLRRGQPSNVTGQWGERIKLFIVYVLAQFRLFRYRKPGIAHFFIFWGFLILSLTILFAFIEGIAAFSDPDYIVPVIGYIGPLALLQDILAVLVIIAVLYDLYVRLAEDPERYTGSHKREGVRVLIYILLIMITLLVMNSIRINLGVDPNAGWRPISSVVGRLFAGMEETTQIIIEESAYWVHLLVVLIFLIELPQGKHFHVVTSAFAVFLRDLEPRGGLHSAPEFNGDVGVSKVEQFRWRQMLDFYTCTECGRCQDYCPAYAGQLPLSPKLLMMDLRDHLKERGIALTKESSNTSTHQSILEKELVGDVITDQTLWACTTCYACDQECPLLIDHISPIVDMRRHLVMEGRVDAELQDALANLARYGNSFGKSARARARWARKIKPKIKDARSETVQYLWFVGDYASFSSTLTDVTKLTANVFRKLGLDFGILYDGENHSGNDVRRVGEEGLFEMLVENNMAVLSECNYETIVTTDPHTYNTLKNEYPTNGNGCTPVLHYTELLDELITSNHLSFNKKLNYKVTYHDPCYLGRYNDVYEAPRRVIEATGCQLVEMPRHGDRTFCCGAGGGRIWMEDNPDIQERPSENRVQEAANLPGVSTFVVTCPKDLVMFQDAVKTTGQEDKIVVKDIIELVGEALELIDSEITE
jgi:Fe-S oxidoreductase